MSQVLGVEITTEKSGSETILGTTKIQALESTKVGECHYLWKMIFLVFTWMISY